jgi:hypothetical protein
VERRARRVAGMRAEVARGADSGNGSRAAHE